MNGGPIARVVTHGVFELDGGSWEVDNNIWLVGDDSEVVVFDAAHDAGPIIDAVSGRHVVAVVCTHGHNDHVTVAPQLSEALDAPVLLHPADDVLWRMTHPDKDFRTVNDGDTLRVAGHELRAIHTPGHSPGSCCLHIPEAGVLFSGGPVSTDSALGLGAVRDLSAVHETPVGWKRLYERTGLVDLDTPPELLAGALAGMRIYVGYAGWAGGQLEDEIDEGAWYVVPAEPADVFDTDPEHLWRRVLRRQPGAIEVSARQTRARSEASNSSTPHVVSITSGPDRPSRPSSLMITASHRRETIPMPPKQPYWPPSSTSTGTPAPRTRSTARMISEIAIRPALASCRRTPPDSTSSSTASGCSSRARSSRPTILAPWTSPTAPPMKAPSWAASNTRRPPRTPRPTMTPSSNAAGVSS